MSDTLGELGYSESLSFGGDDNKDIADGGAEKFYGKYRGTVINNIDPMNEGRLLVQVPDVLGLFISSWAQPCVPFGGIETGMYVIPQLKAGVWVEFEQGSPDKPIWVGCFWGTAAEVPKTGFMATPGLPVFIVQTPAQNAISVHDSPIPPNKTGGVLLKTASSSISIGNDGVTITAPRIELNAVDISINGITYINKGALKVI